MKIGKVVEYGKGPETERRLPENEALARWIPVKIQSNPIVKAMGIVQKLFMKNTKKINEQIL